MDKQATRELTKEEAELLNKDLEEVLKKHNVEMGVIAAIQIVKRIEIKEDGIKSPFVKIDDGDNGETEKN